METDNYFKQLLNWFGSVLKDETGNPSSKRVVGVLCGLTLCITLFANSFSHGEIKPSDILVEAVTALAFGCLGLTAVEKIFEKKNPTPPVDIPADSTTEPPLE
jgi:hypothetical protein